MSRARSRWSRSGVSRPTIIDFESGKREPHPTTLFVLMSELAAAGVVRGVEFGK
jgi:hypothetical protein